MTGYSFGDAITSQNPGSTRFGDVPVTDINAAGLLMAGVIKPVMASGSGRAVRAGSDRS